MADDAEEFAVDGWERAGDGGGAVWRRAVDPSPGPGRRRHKTGSSWFELTVESPRPEMLGAAADWDGKTGRDNGPIFQEMIAWAEGRPIRLGTGRYLASPISIAGPATIIGQGSGRTMLVQAETTGLGGRGIIYAESAPAGSTIKGLVFRDLALDGGVETRGFEQFTHLASVNGVEDVLFERVAFMGFRGDGLYIGSGLKGGQRHNRNVRVRNCRFDGRNADNRNGISVLDIDGITIEGCIFARCSRRDMPGAIDFEPDVDSSLAVIRNIVISNNRFRDVGGGVATICFHFAPKLEPPQNVRISGNTAIDSGRAFLYMNVMQVSPGPRPDQNIHLSNNTYAGGGGSPFLLDGAKGLRFSGNRWSNLEGLGHETDQPAAVGEGVPQPRHGAHPPGHTRRRRGQGAIDHRLDGEHVAHLRSDLPKQLEERPEQPQVADKRYSGHRQGDGAEIDGFVPQLGLEAVEVGAHGDDLPALPAQPSDQVAAEIVHGPRAAGSDDDGRPLQPPVVRRHLTDRPPLFDPGPDIVGGEHRRVQDLVHRRR